MTYESVPVANAIVTLTPVEQGGNASSAKTLSDGTFVMTTFAMGDGVVPDDYIVTVSLARDWGDADMTIATHDSSDADFQLPQRYKSRDSSGLRCEIVEGRQYLEIHLHEQEGVVVSERMVEDVSP